MTNEQALEILEHNWTKLVNLDYTDEELGQALDLAIKALEDKSQGKWVGNKFDEHMCNKCGHYALYEEEADGQYYEVQSDFCPNCGAKMGGEEE